MIVLLIAILVFDVIIMSECSIILSNQTKKIVEEKKETNKIRKHSKIQVSNYSNSYNKRGYEQFKNEKTGLYEPQKPHQGIELKPKKED